MTGTVYAGGWFRTQTDEFGAIVQTQNDGISWTEALDALPMPASK